ncbi:MAG: autotransporter outer membrane beta-barrel domain-containing protein [Thermoguttaceae bacterium]|nr:autotransporter outer membrane beta-barrel domain-containing protein [Thermoguttaceae bacterium]
MTQKGETKKKWIKFKVCGVWGVLFFSVIGVLRSCGGAFGIDAPGAFEIGSNIHHGNFSRYFGNDSEIYAEEPLERSEGIVRSFGTFCDLEYGNSVLSGDLVTLGDLPGGDDVRYSSPVHSSESLNRGTFAAIGDVITEQQTSSTAWTNGEATGFSQDVILRGAVSIPKFRCFQIWGTGYAGSGNIRPGNYDEKINNSLGGTMIGINLGMGGCSNITGFYNYNNSKMKYSSQTRKQKTNLFGLGYNWHPGGFNFTVQGSYGTDSYSANTAFSSRKPKGHQATGYMEGGIDLQVSRMFVVKPFSGFQYSYLAHDQFEDRIISSGRSRVDYDAFYSLMGTRVDANLDIFTFQGRFAWIHQFRSQNESIQNLFIGRYPGSITPTQVFYEGTGAGRDYLWSGVGVRCSLLNLFSFVLDYDLLINSYQTTHIGSVGILFGF